MRSALRIFTFFLIVFALGGCTKYPENKLWFKDPAKAFKGGKITLYTINSVDHMHTVRALYRDFPYNYFGTSIPDVLDQEFSYSDGSLSSSFGDGSMKFSQKGKDVEISFHPINEDKGAQNIFIAPSVWKILKLTKQGQLKIQAVIDYKIYQIQFN
jgi:hypothetical protein